jgi:hypothetical protein
VVGFIAIAIALRAGPSARHKTDATAKGPGTVQVPSVTATDPNASAIDPEKEKKAGNAAKMGPPKPELPVLFQPAVPWDAATLQALRREFYGPLESVPSPPVGTPVLRVSRGGVPGPGSFRSLAEALAAAPEGASIIEINDRGPLFLRSLPVLAGRDVWLRSAPGMRPVLAWEPPQGAKDKTPATLFSLRGGHLIIDGFDIVGKWTSDHAAVPTTLCQVVGGQFTLRSCTVSLAGAQPQGIALARLKRGETESARLHISGCYARGIDLTAVTTEDTAADVLIDHSLIAGNAQPLVRVAGRDEDEVTLRIVHSTLVAAQNCVSVDRGAVTVAARVCDAILARNDPAAAEGDLVRIAKSADPRVRWRVVNSVYAGWKQLLSSDTKSIDGGDLTAWHGWFGYREGDRALPETWPHNPPTQLEDLPASVFMTYETPVAFAATAGQEPVGVVIGQLPPEPADWLKRTFDRPPLVLAAAADPGVPAIDVVNDGLYHGERIELPPRADVGALLGSLLQQRRPLAPRVVFHLAGSGAYPTSPLPVTGVSELVVYFETPKQAIPPITLIVNPLSRVLNRPALIEVERGSLELIGAHIFFENSRSALMPSHLIKVTGGKLILHHCQLQGPLGKAPDAFRALLALNGPAATPLECRISDSMLLSGKDILRTSGAAVNLSVRRSLLLATGDAVAADQAALDCELEGNTWALRRALIATRIGGENTTPIAVRAAANYFTDPFGDGQGQSTLLRLPDGYMARGLLAWQGKGNAFDRRLDSFATVVAQPAPGKLQYSDWLALWGRAGEQAALTVEAGPAAKTPFNLDAPQLDRLGLPRTVRPEPGNPPPGADLARFGVLRKKG